MISMMEEERKAVEEAVALVLPHVANIGGFLEEVRRYLEESGSIREFMLKVEERIAKAEDETERTDFVILRNQLARMVGDITGKVEE